ncbi:MAG: GntR family transcriptional regulator [Gemmatimonadaceae bacterium]
MTPASKGAPRRAARPEQVYQKLRELIVRGQLAPGSRVIETDVATRLGVSRTPVRAALQRLQQEGFVVDTPSLQQSRPTVAPMTKEDARELFNILAEIEGLAARMAASCLQMNARPWPTSLPASTTNFARRRCQEPQSQSALGAR